MTASQVNFVPTTAQVASKPSEERIRRTINSIFGPTEIISRRDGDKVRLFIPAEIIRALEKANMREALGLEEEEKVLDNPGLKAFLV